jgi:pyruvate carboxylase
MAGLCRPYAASALVKALKDEIDIPVHFHTHDTSGINAGSILRASDAGVDVVDLAIASMSGSTSQPNLNSIVAALQRTPRDTGLDLDTLNEFSDYWEHVRTFLHSVRHRTEVRQRRGLSPRNAGGQYTNLKEQAASMGLGHRWPEIARCYAEVNQLFGDIVKVTPFVEGRRRHGALPFHPGHQARGRRESRAGQHKLPRECHRHAQRRARRTDGRLAHALLKVVLGSTKQPKRAKIEPVKLKEVRTELGAKLKYEPTDEDLYSHLMYPQVFADFAKFQREFSDVSCLPTPAFFYGLKPGEEVNVAIDEGKVLFIKLISAGTPDKDGRRVITYELNGYPREAVVVDKTLAKTVKARAKADGGDPMQIGAPIPGMVTALSATVGGKVAKGDKLATLEAMKMQTNILAPADGVIAEVLVTAGDSVESGDLIVKLRS